MGSVNVLCGNLFQAFFISNHPVVSRVTLPPPLLPFQCLILQIDFIRCIIRLLIHHGNGLGGWAAQMCFRLPITGRVQSLSPSLFLLRLLLLLLLQVFGSGWQALGGWGRSRRRGRGCNWRLEPSCPSRCPHQSISFLFIPGDPLGKQGSYLFKKKKKKREYESFFYADLIRVWEQIWSQP